MIKKAAYKQVHATPNRVASISLLALSMTVPGWATSIFVANPSFEANVLGVNGIAACAQNWTCTGTDAITDHPGGIFFASGVPNGVNAAAVGALNISASANFAQTLTTSLLADTTYTLSVSVGHDLTALAFDSYEVDLEADGVVLASDATLTPLVGAFALDRIVFDSGASPAELGQLLTIRLAGTGTGNNKEVWFDNVILDASPTSSAPEPAPMTLVVGGLAIILARRLPRPRRPALSATDRRGLD